MSIIDQEPTGLDQGPTEVEQGPSDIDLERESRESQVGASHEMSLDEQVAVRRFNHSGDVNTPDPRRHPSASWKI